MLKQLIRDSIPVLLPRSIAVRSGLEKFALRSLRGDEDTGEPASGTRLLARVLAAPIPQAQLVEEYIRDLTGGQPSVCGSGNARDFSAGPLAERYRCRRERAEGHFHRSESDYSRTRYESRSSEPKAQRSQPR